MINRLVHWFNEPAHLFLILVVMAGLLVISLGANILGYNKNQTLHAHVTALEQSKKQAAMAAYAACVKSKPFRHKLISGLVKFYTHQTEQTHQILQSTKLTSPFYTPRLSAYANDLELVHVLEQLEPIKCTKSNT